MDAQAHWERVLEESLGAEEPVRGRDVLPPLPPLDDPSDPSMDFELALVDHVYHLACGGPGYDLSPYLIEVARFDASDNEKSPSGMLWVARSDTSVGFLAFRGTLGAREWALDAVYWQSDYAFDRPTSRRPAFHHGFLSIYGGIRDAVRAAFEKHPTPLNELYIVGHSMGGPLAILASVDLAGASQGSRRLVAPTAAVSVLTCGSPRPANPDWVAEFEERLPEVDVVNLRAENDQVPTVPLASMIDPFRPITGEHIEYSHVGRWNYFRSARYTLADAHGMANYREYARTAGRR